MWPIGPVPARYRIVRPRLSTFFSLFVGYAILIAGLEVRAHDIPNARVDRSIQVSVEPGRLRIDYEVALAELTLTQELRALIGNLPGADRIAWFDAYGKETGPLNAKGILITLDAEPVALKTDGFGLTVEDHLRFKFYFSADIKTEGALTINDTNFATSEGTSRLAIRGRAVAIEGDNLPTDVESIPVRPVWQLSDTEERRTRIAEFRYRLEKAGFSQSEIAKTGVVPNRMTSKASTLSGLSSLLDVDSKVPRIFIALGAFLLGAVHALQPGHGKTLVAASVVSEQGSWNRGALLAIITTLTHTGSVLLFAVVLWETSTIRVASIHIFLTHSAGFLIAAVGLWRLGRHFGGFSEHGPEHEIVWSNPDRRPGLLSLGIAGGLVPCWDAVGLIVLTEAIGRLSLGIGLVIAFSLGMGLVLVAIGWFATRFRNTLLRLSGEVWERRLSLSSSLVLTLMGFYLLRL